MKVLKQYIHRQYFRTMYLKEIQSCWSSAQVCSIGANGSSMIGFIPEVCMGTWNL